MKVTDKDEYGRKLGGYRYYIEFNDGQHEFMTNSASLYNSLEIGQMYLIQYQSTNKLIAPNTASIQVDMKAVKILEKLEEKAVIDWNNYLTPKEVEQFLAKDDKVESAENIIYSKEFKKRYKDFHNELQAKYNNSWTKRELVDDLVDFYNHGNLLTEALDDKWKLQMDNKTHDELLQYLQGLYQKLSRFNDNDTKIKSQGFYELLDKINYVENKTGRKPKLGRELH